MKVYVNNRQTAVRLDVKLIRAVVKQTIALEAFKGDEVTIHFVTPKKISDLHLQFFNDPSVTDCMSFPLNSNDAGHRSVSGDVFVCPQQAIHYVAEHGGDALTETILYVIHGLLHLMGYDDLEPKARRKMRLAEKRHLANLKQLGFNS